MCRGWVKLLLTVAFGLFCGPSNSAAPRVDTVADAQAKAVKEFVGRVLGAIGRQDFDTLTEFCAVPFAVRKGHVQNNTDRLKEDLAERFHGDPKFDGSKHTVLAIQPFKEARGRFSEQEARDAAVVLSDDDVVVRVEVFEKRGTTHGRLLIRVKDGKLRLAGIQPESEDK
jgi:hypothetical protein